MKTCACVFVAALGFDNIVTVNQQQPVAAFVAPRQESSCDRGHKPTKYKQLLQLSELHKILRNHDDDYHKQLNGCWLVVGAGVFPSKKNVKRKEEQEFLDFCLYFLTTKLNFVLLRSLFVCFLMNCCKKTSKKEASVKLTTIFVLARGSNLQFTWQHLN